MYLKSLLILLLFSNLYSSDINFLKKVCSSCHSLKSKDKWVDLSLENAPRMSTIIDTYKKKYGDKSTKYLKDYLLNPSKKKQIVRHYYINKYSPMPSMKMFMTEKEMENISNYLIKNY